MANEEHLKILKQGVEVWNKWRDENPDVAPDLSFVNLSNMNLSKADFRDINFFGAKLNNTDLRGTNLRNARLINAQFKNADLSNAYISGAILTKAILEKSKLNKTNLSRTYLWETNLIKAELNSADLDEASLIRADFREAKLIGTILTKCHLIETNFENAVIKNCKIYGISAWSLILNNTVQDNLIITPENSSVITVDNLEVAQFIYLLVHNEKIRNVIDTITSKVVLILGRFTTERKIVLDAIRAELRNRDYLPVLFDFKKPNSKSFIETVGTLAHMARFVIADFTDPKIVLQEVQYIVPDISVPVQPLLLEGVEEPITISDLQRSHHLLLDTHRYKDINDLLETLEEKVIAPAEAKVFEIRRY